MNPRPAGVARRLIVLGAAAGVALGVWPADRPRRIGYISFFPRPSSGVVPVFDAFFAGMREQGYEEGRDYVMDWRHTGGKPEGFDAHAAALVADGVDLFFCLTTGAAMAAKRATSAIPIVFSGVSDPVTSGLVPSLARPGGNLTGLSAVDDELHGKRLELLRELLPQAREVAVLWMPDLVLEPHRADADRGAGASARHPHPAGRAEPCRGHRGCHPATRAHAHRRVVHPPGALACLLERRAGGRSDAGAPADHRRGALPPCRWRLADVRGGHRRAGAPRRRLRRPDLQGRQARRPPSPAAAQVRTADQPEDRPCARCHGAQ